MTIILVPSLNILRYADLDATVVKAATAHREITFPSVRSFGPVGFLETHNCPYVRQNKGNAGLLRSFDINQLIMISDKLGDFNYKISL
jgi:hypothetical protein